MCLHDTHSEAIGCITAIQDTSRSSPEWILNGSRSFVVKSTHSNLLVVTAITEEESEYNGDPSTRKFITFVLDSSTRGITFKESSNTTGCNEVPYGTLEFSNVRLNGGNSQKFNTMCVSLNHSSFFILDSDNVLSEKYDNRSAAEQLTCNSRIQSAILNSIQIKQILNYLTSHLLSFTYNGVKLMYVFYVFTRR